MQWPAMIRQFIFAGLATFLGIFARPVLAQTARPNFLFIYTDDQRFDALSFVQKEQGGMGRFPWFETPNMDRLARDGIWFRNAFVTESLCSPSRASFLSGQYNHTNGVVNNHMSFPLDDITSSGILAKAGYDTAYFGKWHHANQKERPGFNYIASFIGQGRYDDCPFNVNGVMTPSQGWVDDVVTDYTLDYLKNHDKSKPFDIVVGFKSPHDPRTPSEQGRDRFNDTKPRPVPNLFIRPPFLPIGVESNQMVGLRSWGEKQRDYFRTISSADDCVGRILDALDQLGLAQNTVVIFTSDNGYYLGEHSLGDKRSAYEESMRIPLLLRWPAGAAKGVTVDSIVLNIDLAPTLLDLAGMKIPGAMQGISWKPLLDGKAPDDWRKAFLYEYFHERNYGSPTVVAVRTDDAKLITYPGHDDWTELFNLKADPYEVTNLYKNAADSDLRKEMETELARQEKATDYHVPENADPLIPGQPGHF